MKNEYIKFSVTAAEKLQIQKRAETLFLKPSTFSRMVALGVELKAPEIIYVQNEPAEIIKEDVVSRDFLEPEEREILKQLVSIISDDGYMKLNTIFQKDLKVMTSRLLKRDDHDYEIE